jgi:hypothetical protein
MTSSFTKQVQMGLESAVAQGTPVTVDTAILGSIKVPQDRKIQRPVENIGLRIPHARTAVYQYLMDGATLSIEHGYFQALPLLFSLGILGGVTPVEQTADQDDWLWSFVPSLTATNTPDSATLAYGDGAQAYEVEYVMAREYSLSAAIGKDEPWKLETTLFGRQISTGAFEALAIPTVEPMMANMTRVYYDELWADLGTNPVDNILKNVSIKIVTGVHPQFHGSTALYFDTHAEGILMPVFEFTFERGEDSDGFWDDYRAQTPMCIRVAVTGGQIGTGDDHSLMLDMYGIWDTIEPIAEEQDDDILDTGVFVPLYDAVGAQTFQALVTTDVAAI